MLDLVMNFIFISLIPSKELTEFFFVEKTVVKGIPFIPDIEEV
jgi:hypothetical protein